MVLLISLKKCRVDQYWIVDSLLPKDILGIKNITESSSLRLWKNVSLTFIYILLLIYQIFNLHEACLSVKNNNRRKAYREETTARPNMIMTAGRQAGINISHFLRMKPNQSGERSQKNLIFFLYFMNIDISLPTFLNSHAVLIIHSFFFLKFGGGGISIKKRGWEHRPLPIPPSHPIPLSTPLN